MDGYLLDTNVLVDLLSPGGTHRDEIVEKIKAIDPNSPLYVATPALAELEVGCFLGARDYDEARNEIASVIQHHKFQIRDFTHHTAAVYGDLKAKLMRKFSRKGKGKAKRPESWTFPDTAEKLCIDELDLFMVAHALEQNLVLVTNDLMKRIQEGIGDIANDLRIEDWTDSS